jgi:tetratricopeptide (TPR) repeat protein
MRRHKVLIRVKSTLAIAAVALGLLATPAAGQENPWVDTAEYELVVNGIQKEANPQKKLQLLTQWKEKYPTSKFKGPRLQAFLQTYQQLGNAAEMKKVAAEMTTEDPNGLMGLIGYQTLNLLTISMNDKSDAALADGEKASAGLLGILDRVKKPDQVAEDAWAKEKTNNTVLAHRTAGWALWQKKNYEGAEQAFTKALQANPANGEISGWMGTVVMLQRKPEKQSAGLYHFARAASLEGAGALPDAARTQTKAYVEKTYVNFHGSRDGLDEILNKAKTECFPPAGFEIESKVAIQMKNREKLKAENPMLGLWLENKDTLKGDGGQAFFTDSLKGSDGGVAAVGGVFKGKLITATPETKPKELQLSVEDGITPDVILKLSEALPGKAEAGIEIAFKGTVSEFSKDPFIVTFEADPDDVQGWPVQAPAAKKGAGKKGAGAPAPKAKKK